MVAMSRRGPLEPLHPLHALLLAFPFPLFLGGLASDLAYRATFEIQWANFAQWLNAGGLLGGGFVLLWATIDLFRSRAATRHTVYFLVLAGMWILGLVNALVHAKDAWAMMPEGLWLSAITALLALVASWIGYSGFHDREVR